MNETELSTTTPNRPARPVLRIESGKLNTGDLSFLKTAPLGKNAVGNSLLDLSVVVIGGGPAGLTFARLASAQGADVTVLEQAGDPRNEEPGYTDRSFNITLDNVGRYVLGDSSVWEESGSLIIGRAVHNFQGTNKAFHARYGSTPEAELISIPRPVLRQKMINMAVDAGANVRFRSKVTDVDPDEAIVWFTDPGLTEHQIKADMVVFADGLHSLGNQLALKKRTADYYLKPESRSCVTGMIYPESGHQLSLNHIHFWNELAADSTAIGIPNVDGSIAVLLISNYDDIGPEEYPFATPELAKIRLERDFPQILKHDPNMVHFLPGRRRYKFHYKAASTFLIGDRSVVVGDAGMVMPPWAGFGANSAMYSAATLVYHLMTASNDLSKSLTNYSNQQTLLARYMLDYVKDLGDFLSGPVTQEPDKHGDPGLPPLIKRAQETVTEAVSLQQPSMA